MNNMGIYENVLKKDETAIFELRSLYEKYGYIQYKMSKFEEYDLYVKNKDFLVSDSIITFNDTNGKLMALKPDVTLSIIKNTDDSEGCVQKVYYNENVYRVSKGTHTFKEIMQTGLECIGDIDSYNICEVVTLAAKSLNAISGSFIMDISHMGIVSAILDELSVPVEEKAEILKCIGEKNIHDIKKICGEYDADCTGLVELVSTYGKMSDVIAKLKEIKVNKSFEAALAELERINAFITHEGFEDRVNLDFSIVNDMNYYSGIVFRGFIEGIPVGILSGGQYDKLMAKMGKKTGAIGFAVYLDMLERLNTNAKKYDVDTVLIYDKDADEVDIANLIKMFTDNGNSVLAQKSVPQKLKYRQLIRLKDRGFEILENND